MMKKMDQTNLGIRTDGYVKDNYVMVFRPSEICRDSAGLSGQTRVANLTSL